MKPFSVVPFRRDRKKRKKGEELLLLMLVGDPLLAGDVVEEMQGMGSLELGAMCSAIFLHYTLNI